MKLNHILGLSAAAVLFASCDTDLLDNSASQDGRILRISSVSQNAFAADARSRSTYSDTYAKVFEDGDRLGLVLVDADGKQVGNVPFTYSEGSWTNDRNQLYQSDVTRIVAYAPYDENLPAEACDAEAVKKAVRIPTDQSTPEAFEAADLLVCELNHPDADLAIDFTHAFSMIQFEAQGKVNAGGQDYVYDIALEGMSVTIGEDCYTPCALNGSYACIVRDATDLQPESFKYTYVRFGEDRATKTIVNANRTDAGTIYSFPCPAVGAVSTGITAGSYYCVAPETGEVVMIPAGAAAIPAGLECRGIVFHTMDGDAFADFAADNGLAAANYPGIGGKHGLIVSLEPGGLLLNGYDPTNAAHVTALENVFADFENSGDTNRLLGYKLTATIAAAYRDNADGIVFDGLGDIAGTLDYCTPWYIPSFGELKYLIRGEEHPDVVSTAGQEIINGRIAAVSGTIIEGNMPSVSYKHAAGFCIMEKGNEMGWYGVPSGEKCRPVCAF